MVDLGGYVIILVETKDKRVKLYGSPADKAELEVADEILEINGKPLNNCSHAEVISHIHNCIKSRTICLRVKRRTGNKLAEELAESSNVQDAFVIAVEQQARERLERLSALRKIKPVDMTALSQELCDDSKNGRDTPIYSAPVSDLGSPHNVKAVVENESRKDRHLSGALTDEELELNQRINRSRDPSRSGDRSRDHSRGSPRSRDAKRSNDRLNHHGETMNGSRTRSKDSLISSNSCKSRDSRYAAVVTGEAERAKVPNRDVSLTKSTEIRLERSAEERVECCRQSDTRTVNTLSADASDCSKPTSLETGSCDTDVMMIESKTDSSREESCSDKKPGCETIVPHEISQSRDGQPETEGVADYPVSASDVSKASTNMPPKIDEERECSADQKEVLIGGDTEENRSARGSIRQRHQVKTFTERREENSDTLHVKDKPALKATHSLKTLFELEELSRCVDRITKAVQDSPAVHKSERNDSTNSTSELGEKKEEILCLKNLIEKPMFSSLLSIHNTIQLVQCFRCPPPPLCTDARDLVQECMISLQGSHLSEAAEILDILNRIEFEALFYSHDKLADLQGGLPWKRCLAEMWTKDRPGSATPDSNTRVVRITKHNEPLGATVRNEGEKVVIGRVVKGGAAERSGNLQPGDEVLEVNGLRLKGKSVHDICSTLCQMSGTLTFVIIPGNQSPQEDESQPVYHYRAHFSYSPEDDLYIPCHELGISFQRGDILHVINKNDPHWWQAYRDGEWTQTLAGLIPSLGLQQHRLALQKQKKEQEARDHSVSPARKKTTSASLLCAKKTQKKRTSSSPFKRDIPPYEEMALYYPQQNQRRPLILVGPPSIGRHELRQRLLDDTSKFAAPVPHTTRPRETGEIDGVDYNFVTKQEFETMVNESRFLEHGEYDKQMYGTSTSSIKSILASGKICVLNIQPSSLPAFHDSDLKPYVVFLTPPSPHISRHIKLKNGEVFKEEEYKELVIIAHHMEDNFGHYFDSVIPFEDVDFVLKQVMYEISLLEKEPQWVPAKWVQ